MTEARRYEPIAVSSESTVIGSGEFLREELVPLGVGKRDVVQGFELST